MEDQFELEVFVERSCIETEVAKEDEKDEDQREDELY